VANYVPVLVWTISAIICAYVVKKRGVKATALRAVFVALVGPIAIPFALMVKPENAFESE